MNFHRGLSYERFEEHLLALFITIEANCYQQDTKGLCPFALFNELLIYPKKKKKKKKTIEPN
jgi:hypothetical protein